MTIQITRPEIELINDRLGTGAFQDAEDVILQALRSTSSPSSPIDGEYTNAIERLRTFGKTHGLSLGGMTIRHSRDEARP